MCGAWMMASPLEHQLESFTHTLPAASTPRFCTPCLRQVGLNPEPLSDHEEPTGWAPRGVLAYSQATYQMIRKAKFRHAARERHLLEELMALDWLRWLPSAIAKHQPRAVFIVPPPSRHPGCKQPSLARYLGERLAQRFGAMCIPEEALIWCRETHPQHSLHTRKERWANIHRAMTFYPDRLPRNVQTTLPNALWILLDDFSTTGLTQQEIGRAIECGLGPMAPPLTLLTSLCRVPLVSDEVVTGSLPPARSLASPMLAEEESSLNETLPDPERLGAI